MFLDMMGFHDPYGMGYPAPPQDIDSTPPDPEVVPIAGDTSPPPDDVGMFGADGSYVGSYGSVQDNPAAPPAPSGGDDVVPIAGDSSTPEPGGGDGI